MEETHTKLDHCLDYPNKQKQVFSTLPSWSQVSNGVSWSQVSIGDQNKCYAVNKSTQSILESKTSPPSQNECRRTLNNSCRVHPVNFETQPSVVDHKRLLSSPVESRSSPNRVLWGLNGDTQLISSQKRSLPEVSWLAGALQCSPELYSVRRRSPWCLQYSPVVEYHDW